MTVDDIMTELKGYGSESIKKIFLKHGVKEPFFGVKVEHLKIIQKKVKTDYKLSNELFATNNADAMYLAGLIADDDKMTKKDLQGWVKKAVSNNISEYTVPWVAAEGKHGFELGMEWIDSDQEHIAAAGWATLSCCVALRPDNELDIPALKALLKRVEKKIHTAKNRECSMMNGFIIAVGTYVKVLTNEAIATANKIGTITIQTNGNTSTLPAAIDYINKTISKGTIGKKKKTVKC